MTQSLSELRPILALVVTSVLAAWPTVARAQQTTGALRVETKMQDGVRLTRSSVFLAVPAPRAASLEKPGRMPEQRSHGQRRRSDTPMLSGDQTIGFSGVLGQTVNQVVPIPGTDMIRVGAVQEGSIAQNNTRSTAEASPHSGAAPSGAVIIFRISRP